MKQQKSLPRSLTRVALATILILLMPFLAMQFTDQVNWGAIDFIIMGMLIFGTGCAYILLTRSLSNILYKAAVALAIGSTLLLIWVNLAVGLIGSGPNTANLMYIAIVVIVIGGTFLSRFTINGMERVMFITALTLVLFAVIQLLAKTNEFTGSSVTEVIAVNSFFAILFAVAGLLFRYIKPRHLPGHITKIEHQQVNDF
ncbi:MAG: hypothetical protein JO072_02475 [Parafilimonas sp.]|nr:hypothetical protein [Parafilimonas sp.]